MSDDAIKPSSSLYDTLRRHAPAPPLLAAGAIGGPFVIVSLTPLRNAMSNAAQDQTASFGGLYAKVGGPSSQPLLRRLQVAYTGARVSALPACPQWVMIGPAFHLFHSFLVTPAALLATASLETFIAFGSQTRNAQLSYNVQQSAPSKALAPEQLSSIVRPWGPGAPFFVLRNACGMAGIRWLSPPCQAALEPILPGGVREICADMAASTLTCGVSAPLNACWVYTVTTPALWGAPIADQAKALLQFLRRQYLDGSGTGLSRLAVRDLSVRAVYIAACFTMFSSIERFALRHWPKPNNDERGQRR